MLDGDAHLAREFLAIGAGAQVVGVTQFCDFPPEAAQKPKVGYAFV